MTTPPTKPGSPDLPNSRETLGHLLDDLMQHPERRAEITAAIEQVFGQERAVLTLDMAGFSATTIRHGIVEFLLMIHKMQVVARPCVEEHGGVVVKAYADNLLCMFDTVEAAVAAARDIVRRLNTVNIILPDARRLFASMGIGYGNVLNIDNQDLFGGEVNLASKLGEDLAEMGEILLTAAAVNQLPGGEAGCSKHEVSVSGITLTYYSIRA